VLYKKREVVLGHCAGNVNNKCDSSNLHVWSIDGKIRCKRDVVDQNGWV